MQSLLISLSAFIKPYVMHISVVLVTCSLVVLDSYIHNSIKRMIKGLNFILRIAVYVMLFTFVYGFLVTYFSPMLAKLLFTLSDGLLLVFLLISFISLGVLIERK